MQQFVLKKKLIFESNKLSMEIMMDKLKPIKLKKKQIFHCKSHVTVWKRHFGT